MLILLVLLVISLALSCSRPRADFCEFSGNDLDYNRFVLLALAFLKLR